MQSFTLTMKYWGKLSLIGLLISTPLLTPIVDAYASSQSPTETFEYNDELTTAAQDLASSDTHALKTTSKNLATSATASGMESWLNQFGTARIQLNVDENGSWRDSAFDYLLPVYDNKNAVLFSQFGLRAPNGRLTTNLGLGVRTFYVENWMFGGNVFFDHDYDGGNRRVGVGGEAWTDNLKISANGYFGTTDWHTSHDLNGYDEKPADGFDLRVEGYLPAYPQLGANLMYEKYYGDNVALFDKDDLQKNPSAVTVGVSYTPIPLATAGVDYKRGQDSHDEVHFSMNLRYVIGESWQSQISPDNVALRRSLAGSRYDLVERNNEIVMQYQKKKQQTAVLADMSLTSVRDHSPADGASTNQIVVHAITTDGKPAQNAAIRWSVSGSGKLSATSGVTNSNGDATVNVTNATAQVVTVTATSGAIVRSTPSSFDAAMSENLTLQLGKDNSIANGTDENTGVATLKDSEGNAIANVAVSWKVNNGATIVHSDSKTDSQGQAKMGFSSSTAGPVSLTASAGNQTQSVNANFVEQGQSQLSLKVTTTTNNVQADGKSKAVIEAIVTDESGKTVKGEQVTWSNTGNAVPGSPRTVTSDSNGKVTFVLTDTVPQTVTATAIAGNATGSADVTFVNVVEKVSKMTIAASGSGSKYDPMVYTAVATDSAGETVQGAQVKWTGGIITDTNIVCTENSTVTDASGQVNKTCYNSTSAVITNVRANVIVDTHYASDTMNPASAGITQDYAPTP